MLALKRMTRPFLIRGSSKNEIRDGVNRIHYSDCYARSGNRQGGQGVAKNEKSLDRSLQRMVKQNILV